MSAPRTGPGDPPTGSGRPPTGRGHRHSGPGHHPGEEFRHDPTAWVGRLGRELRAEGVGCSLTESILAADSLALLDPADPLDLYFGLRAAFLSRDADGEAFDRCFWRLWHGGEPGRQPRAVRPGEPGSDPARAAPRAGGPEAASLASGEREAGGREGGPAEEGPRAGAVYSPFEAIARRPFATVDESELRAFDAWMDRLMVRLATRRSRRLRSGGRRGLVDLRRSLRDAPRHDGELIRLARRRRRIDRPRIVLLCDVSGSMERYSRFLVRFLLASARARDVETFAFSTRLTHLTPWLARARLDEALASLRARGWSSGTRIGESLQAFLDGYGRTMLGQRTVVIVLSDGLDQGEVEPLERALRTIQRASRKVIWLNPLLESSRYAPEARGMRAALPYVDEFASGHSLEALARLPDLIRL